MEKEEASGRPADRPRGQEWEKHTEGKGRLETKDRRGGAASRGMESSGPGSESPDEKSVIIIITAERTTIINHH